MLYLQQVQPTGFFGVPRIWEKIYDALNQGMKELQGGRRAMINWATYQGYNYWSAILSGR